MWYNLLLIVWNKYSSLLTAWQLAYLNPRVYNCSVPMAFRPDIAVMAQICDGETPAIKNRRSLQKLKSVRGQTFFSFAKSHNYVDGESSQVQKLFYIFRLMVLQPFIDIALCQSNIYLGYVTMQACKTQVQSLHALPLYDYYIIWTVFFKTQY